MSTRRVKQAEGTAVALGGQAVIQGLGAVMTAATEVLGMEDARAVPVGSAVAMKVVGAWVEVAKAVGSLSCTNHCFGWL